MPEPLEDQRRSDAVCRDSGRLAATMRAEQQHMFGEACTGSEQAVQVARLFELIEPAQSGQNALANAPLLPGVSDDSVRVNDFETVLH